MDSIQNIQTTLGELSSTLDLTADCIAIVLAAGHGKRIKSETSKMLHEIWGTPTVVRVANAAQNGLQTQNQIIVVGIKATEVARSSGKKPNRQFVFQAEQNGTGHAVKVALDALANADYGGDIFIFPGDMGLLTSETVHEFKSQYKSTPCDMMILTGVFEGDAEDNYYGRVLRVPEVDSQGGTSGADRGKVIEIKEQKDILALDASRPYQVDFGGRTYSFSREELIEMREFNTGVYAFRADKLQQQINALSTDNVQGELYLTDLIRIFNQAGLTVQASAAEDNRTVLGFNVKSVLKEMESYARERVYERLKDIISIADGNDFFIADDVVEQIIALDGNHGSLDIYIGKGASIGKNVRLEKKVRIGNRASLCGPVFLAEGVAIQDNVRIAAAQNQQLKIGKNTKICQGNTITGMVEIGAGCLLEPGVAVVGTDTSPANIGNNVVIKGSSHILGSTIEDDILIEHSVLEGKYIKRIELPDGTVQAVRYVKPAPEGLDTITDI
ncbi:MAG: NTP transferase domain-containing protein [bacterium]